MLQISNKSLIAYFHQSSENGNRRMKLVFWFSAFARDNLWVQASMMVKTPMTFLGWTIIV